MFVSTMRFYLDFYFEKKFRDDESLVAKTLAHVTTKKYLVISHLIIYFFVFEDVNKNKKNIKWFLYLASLNNQLEFILIKNFITFYHFFL